MGVANRAGEAGAEHCQLSSSGHSLLRVCGLLGLLLEHAHDVALLHDQQLLAVDLDLGAAPLAEQHLVALLQVDRR